MNYMSLAEAMQWQAQYALDQGLEVVYNRHTLAQIEKVEQLKILNS